MKIRTRILYAVFMSLTAASLACNYPFQGVLPPTPTQTLVPVVTHIEAPQLKEQIQAADTAIQNNQPVMLIVTEEQLNSLLKTEMQDQSTPPLLDPQVLLRNGLVQILGKIEQNGFLLPVSVQVAVTVDSQGRPAFNITSAALGPLPMPDGILDQFESSMNTGFAERFAPDIEQVFVESITISGGVMTIYGRPR